MNTFTGGTRKYYKVYDAKNFKNLAVSFYPLHSQVICMAHLSGAFKSHVDLVLCIIGSDWKDIKLFVLN